MFWLIETKDQLDKFITRDATKAFIEIIPFSYNIHPADNNYISLVYVRPLGYDGYIVAINHEETLNTLGISWLDTHAANIPDVGLTEKNLAFCP